MIKNEIGGQMISGFLERNRYIWNCRLIKSLCVMLVISPKLDVITIIRRSERLSMDVIERLKQGKHCTL